MVQYKLRYFPARGRVEHIRFMMAYKNQPYEQDLIPPEKWAEVKFHQPFHHLPVMYIDGKELSQTQAIARFLANRFGLAGANDFEAALCDMYIDAYHEMVNNVWPSDAFEFAQETAEQKFTERVIPFMNRYEKFLEANGGQWLVGGNQLTWADLTVAEILQRYEELYIPSLFDNHPLLKAHKERVYDLPGIKEYVATREPTTI